MSKPLDILKCRTALAKSEAARLDLELRMMEKLDEIERIKDHVKIQDDHIEKTKLELKQLQGE